MKISESIKFIVGGDEKNDYFNNRSIAYRKNSIGSKFAPEDDNAQFLALAKKHDEKIIFIDDAYEINIELL